MQDSLGDTGDNCPHLGYSFSCLPSRGWRQETREKPAELVMLHQEPTRMWNRGRGQLYQGIELRPSGEASLKLTFQGITEGREGADVPAVCGERVQSHN